MKLTRKSVGAVAGLAALALTGLGLANPAGAATKNSVTIVASNALTSLNPGTPDTNLVTNSDVAYLQGFGFAYYDNKRNLIRNTVFGTYDKAACPKVLADAGAKFCVKYTVNAGRTWSDSTPITGVDLLLSHVLASSAYSIKAGLGDPGNLDTTSKFYSGGYGGTYDSHVIKEPLLSADKMSVTVGYDAFMPDWQIMGPGPSPVHALVHMANGKTKLQGSVANADAKAAFLTAFKDGAAGNNNALLAKIGDVWSNDYNIQDVNDSTNPLLLVSNGGYMIDEAVKNQYITLKKNPRQNSGPKTKADIDTIVYKFMSDGTAAVQELGNGQIDIYQGQPDVDSVAALKKLTNITVKGGTNACFEHVDLRMDAAQGTDGKYAGPFYAYGSTTTARNKARDLRTAFLLAYPRAEILTKLIKPINATAELVNSSFLLPGQNGYDTIIAGSGVSKFTAGTQAERTASALALVKKWYPNASASNAVVDIKLLWGQPTNTRRAAEAALVKAAEAKAGFNVNVTGTQGWSGFLDDNSFDAQFFAWCPSAVSQTGTNANFQSDGSNNFLGYNNPSMDTILKRLEGNLSDTAVISNYLAADKLLIQDAVTLGIFQHPAVTGYDKTLKYVLPAPLVPNLVWNYWQWTRV